jgi:transcriptional regulator of arginine metabolism
MFIHPMNNHSVNDKPRRHDRVMALLKKGGVASQEQLADLLRAEGVRVTQATLSRDLKELGVMKGPAGYILPGAAPAPAPPTNGDLQRALRAMLLSGEVGGNLAVLHTGPGRASALALEIDRAGLRPILGTVAGDDTVFIAARTSRDASRLLTNFKSLAGIA